MARAFRAMLLQIGRYDPELAARLQPSGVA